MEEAAPATQAGSPGSSENATISGQEAEKMAGWIKEDVASGKMTPESAKGVFDQLGTPEADRQPDTRSPELKLIDKDFPVERDGTKYIMPYEPTPTPETQAFEQLARTWLHQADFPRELGNSVIKIVADTVKRTEKLTPAQLQTLGEYQYTLLEKVYGDAIDAKLQSANKMIQALEKTTPGLNRLLRTQGIGDNALLVTQLVSAAERYWARRKS